MNSKQSLNASYTEVDIATNSTSESVVIAVEKEKVSTVCYRMLGDVIQTESGWYVDGLVEVNGKFLPLEDDSYKPMTVINFEKFPASGYMIFHENNLFFSFDNKKLSPDSRRLNSKLTELEKLIIIEKYRNENVHQDL